MILNYFEHKTIKNHALPAEWRSQESLDELLEFLQFNWEQRAIFYDDGKVNSNSMATYMKKVDSRLDQAVRDAIDKALIEVANMPAPFRNHLTKSETQKAVDACNNLLNALDAAIEGMK